MNIIFLKTNCTVHELDMSQDDRTSQTFTDLSEESAAGKIAGAQGGPDVASIDDYNKSGGVVDNANTMSICTIGGFDKEAERVDNTKEAAEVSSIVQEGAEVSSALQRLKEWSTAVQQFNEVFRIVKEARANLKIECRKWIPEFSTAVQESAAHYTDVDQERAAEWKKDFQESSREFFPSILEAATEKSSPSGLDVAEVMRAINRTAADSSISLQGAAAGMFSIGEEERKTWHAAQAAVEAWQTSYKGAAEMLRIAGEETNAWQAAQEAGATEASQAVVEASEAVVEAEASEAVVEAEASEAVVEA